MNYSIRKLKLFFIAIASCIFLATFSAQATIITLQFDNVGPINSIDAGSPEAALGWMVGDTLRLQVTFDDATADTRAAVGNGFFEDPLGFMVLINQDKGTAITYNGGVEIEVDDDEEIEFEAVDNDATAINTPIIAGDIDFNTNGTSFFSDPDSLSAVTADLLANVFPNNSNNTANTRYWDGSSSVTGIGFGNASALVTVTQVGVAIPEPSTYVLFALGIAALGAIRRRRKILPTF